jgi:hypothetical protein
MSVDEEESFGFETQLKALSLVLFKFNQLESRLASIIDRYVGAPDRGGEFFRRHVMHNSITPYAAKVKLVLAISEEIFDDEKLDQSALHRLGHFRNAFAHGDIAKAYRWPSVDDLLVGALDDDFKFTPTVIVESVKADGTIEERPRSEVIAKFFELMDVVEPQLDRLAELLHA